MYPRGVGLVFSDGQIALGSSGRLLLGFWRAPFTHVRLRALRHEAAKLRAQCSGSLGMLAVFESEAIQLEPLSNQELRRDAAKLQVEFAELFQGGQSIVLEGSGFAVAALRGTAIAVQAISRMGQQHVFHSNVTQALTWLGHRMLLVPKDLNEADAVLNMLREHRG